MDLKRHTQQDKSLIYYVWKKYIAVFHHSLNIDNLLHHNFFLKHHVYTEWVNKKYTLFKLPRIFH